MAVTTSRNLEMQQWSGVLNKEGNLMHITTWLVYEPKGKENVSI
jgi:hypothetical protein